MKEELIKITTNEEGKQLVSARELHEKLILEEGKEEGFHNGLKGIYNMVLKKILILQA